MPNEQRRPMQFVFPNADAASGFLSDVIHEGAETFARGRRAIPRGFWDQMVTDRGGARVFESTYRKEQRVYGYQDAIEQADLDYLHERDGLVHAINSQIPMATWVSLPTTDVPTLDEFFSHLMAMGFAGHAIAADTVGRRDGTALLYINATGASPATPLKPSDKIFGFDRIEVRSIDPDKVEPAKKPHPLVFQHGIESITRKIQVPDGAGGYIEKEEKIHGSRLILFKEDLETRHWRGRPKIQPIYDSIWNFRDLEAAQSFAQMEGDPIVVEMLPPDKGLFELDEEAEDVIKEEIGSFVASGKQFVSPVQGITIKRLGSQNLPDVDGPMRILAGKMARDIEFPVNMILPSSRGSEQVTDQDVMQYATNIMLRRNTFAYPILAHLVRLGKFVGDLPGEVSLPLPSKLRWPPIREYNVRERAYAYKTFMSTLDQARKWGRKAPPEIEEMFPVDPQGIVFAERELELKEREVEVKEKQAERPPPDSPSPQEDDKETPP